MLRTISTICLAFLLFSVCPAQQSEAVSATPEKVIFKSGTEFTAQIENEVYTDKINVGADVNFVLTEDVIGAGGDKIEKGSMLYGRVVSVEKTGAKNDTAKVCIMFDFVKMGEEFLPLAAAIVSIEAGADVGGVKFASSPIFSGGTVLSMKGREIHLEKGKIFRLKLTKDITLK